MAEKISYHPKKQKYDSRNYDVGNSNGDLKVNFSFKIYGCVEGRWNVLDFSSFIVDFSKNWKITLDKKWFWPQYLHSKIFPKKKLNAWDSNCNGICFCPSPGYIVSNIEKIVADKDQSVFLRNNSKKLDTFESSSEEKEKVRYSVFFKYNKKSQ